MNRGDHWGELPGEKLRGKITGGKLPGGITRGSSPASLLDDLSGLWKELLDKFDYGIELHVLIYVAPLLKKLANCPVA